MNIILNFMDKIYGDSKTLSIIYVVGAVLLFGASGILRNSKNICRTHTIIYKKG